MRAESFFADMLASAESAALFLAMAVNEKDENFLKDLLRDGPFKFAVTKIGGKTSSDNFKEKIIKAVVGACLHENIIEKNEYELHALLHALEEAKCGIIANNTGAANVALTASIVRKDHWLAVALYGDSALYYLTNHKRIGLGVMHI